MRFPHASRLLLPFSLVCAATAASAFDVAVNLVDAEGGTRPVGTISVESRPYGVLFIPKLEGLPPGLHGFHVHEKPDCGPAMKDGIKTAALAAGGHFDPQKTGRHDGPYGSGHLGDLPPIYVDAAGQATQPVLAPRLRLEDLKGHSLMIHAGGDNHADHPQPLGGGGARIACGAII